MPPTAGIIITLALVFYSIGVWSERIAGRLKPWHLVFFLLGLACDTTGTGMMFAFVGGMTLCTPFGRRSSSCARTRAGSNGSTGSASSSGWSGSFPI